MPVKIPVFSFNYLDKNLPNDTVCMLRNLYKTYHLRCWCYKQLFKSFKRKDLALNLTSAALVAAGSTVGVTINPIALIATGLGVILQVLNKKKKYSRKIEACMFAYTSYQKELNSLRGYLRGGAFDKTILLFELKKMDDLIADQCPPIDYSYRVKYYKKFEVNSFPTPAHCNRVETEPQQNNSDRIT